MSGSKADLGDHEYVVGTVEEVPPGTVRRVDVDGRKLAIVNAGGEYYAISDACPHKGARFSLVGTEYVVGEGTHGELDAEELTIKCPYHYWEFDLETGDVIGTQKKRVPTFETRVVDGEIRVKLR
jgi:nitrite reductase/ring-hydroxylating ferredoxin subunit